jgi:hypothetical protein
MKLDLTLSTITETTPDFLNDNSIISSIDFVKLPPGTEHYKLIATIGSQLKNGKIIELGTHQGIASIAFNYGNIKYGSNNNIYTYDIQYHLKPKIFDNTKISFRMENLFDSEIREVNKDHILSSDLIFIDIDPHEGIMEYDMYLWLKKNNYKGIILLDDIHLGPGHMGCTSGNSMQMFWDKIEEEYKIDLTNVGHWSGTGLVSFNFEEHTVIY